MELTTSDEKGLKTSGLLRTTQQNIFLRKLKTRGDVAIAKISCLLGFSSDVSKVIVVRLQKLPDNRHSKKDDKPYCGQNSNCIITHFQKYNC